MTKILSNRITKNVIKKLLAGQDYRIEIVNQINEDFLRYVIDFFKKVVSAKLKNKGITLDWYRKEFLSDKLNSEDLAINSGLNKKTISNMYNSATREIVLEASKEHYDILYGTINALISGEPEVDLTLTIKFKGVSVDLSISESLVVINNLAVKRAALRGGLWSAIGKRVEGPLMLTLCKLYNLNAKNFSLKIEGGGKASYGNFEREIDFFLKNKDEIYKCEVKLMGKGNPESADAFIARESRIFIADKLSDKNKNQFDSLGAQWVELRSKEGFRRFEKILKKLKIPYSELPKDINKRIDCILDEIIKKDN
ncbi:MAG TPA: CfrBI family restriction endonuclease [Candidatus Nanoarchaeia archaeon]|nr:CfrBI family restriction endonuclease [Candidatus Nanoarchaeia archaeon]